MARRFGNNDPTATPTQKRSNGEQSKHRHSLSAETIECSSIPVELKANPALRSIAVIAITSHALAGEEV
jgi:hypothetical protein